MFKSAGKKMIVGLAAGTLLNLASAAVWAGDNEAGYVVDKSGNPVVTKSGCLLAPKQPKDKLFEACGDVSDSDGDGVNDDKDKCPNTPEGVKVDENGCPLDSDGDGVADYLDNCPNNSAEEISKGVDSNGCPLDSDGDGVPDYRDRCPNTPAEDIAKVNAYGCTEEVLVFDMKADAYFAFDSAKLSAEGQHALSALVAEAAKRGSVDRVDVVGYADHIGSDAYNMSLSERRAQSSAQYLISQGISARKITASGKGETEATGRSASERAKDRRVDVRVHIMK